MKRQFYAVFTHGGDDHFDRFGQRDPFDDLDRHCRLNRLDHLDCFDRLGRLNCSQSTKDLSYDCKDSPSANQFDGHSVVLSWIPSIV